MIVANWKREREREREKKKETESNPKTKSNEKKSSSLNNMKRGDADFMKWNPPPGFMTHIKRFLRSWRVQPVKN